MYTFIVAVALAVASGGGASTPATLPARHFVPDCRIILFGEVLDQVPSDDGKTRGARLERTEDGVLINGKVWVSRDDKRKEVTRTEDYAEYERRGAVIEEAGRQFRTQQEQVGEGRYSASGGIYGDTPQPFHVELYDETVDLAVKGCATCMAYIYVTYKGTTVGMPLRPIPPPSQEEQNATRIDSAFLMASRHMRSGFIVLVTRGGSFTPYPMERADALLAALAKIPALAVPVAENPYGETVYQMLTVDGFTFGPDVVATFVERERGRER